MNVGPIEQNVPLPERLQRDTRKSAVRLALEAMDVGDSFVVTGKGVNALRVQVSEFGRSRTPVRGHSVLVIDSLTARVWRTK